MKKFNDRMLLESLVRKYGKNGVKNAIKNVNESLTHHDYAELEQIVRALINNNEKLNMLLDSAGNPTPRAQRIISVYDAYVLDVFYELVDAENVDCEYIVKRIGRMAEDNEWEYGTEASMIINFLTDIADEVNISINESCKIDEAFEYEQKKVNVPEWAQFLIIKYAQNVIEFVTLEDICNEFAQAGELNCIRDIKNMRPNESYQYYDNELTIIRLPEM